jgi:hypothetical protein
MCTDALRANARPADATWLAATGTERTASVDTAPWSGMLPPPMVSSTQQSSRIRKRKSRRNGTPTKRYNRANGTPAFPVHPEGYDAKAADAKPVSESKQ